MKGYKIERPTVEIEYIELPDYFTTQLIEGGKYCYHRATDSDVVTLSQSFIGRSKVVDFYGGLLDCEKKSIAEVTKEEFECAVNIAVNHMLYR